MNVSLQPLLTGWLRHAGDGPRIRGTELIDHEQRRHPRDESGSGSGQNVPIRQDTSLPHHQGRGKRRHQQEGNAARSANTTIRPASRCRSDSVRTTRSASEFIASSQVEQFSDRTDSIPAGAAGKGFPRDAAYRWWTKKKGHPKAPRFPHHEVEIYLMTISTRRFCGSRTPAPVGTSGWVSPKPWMVMALFGTPSFTS